MFNWFVFGFALLFPSLKNTLVDTLDCRAIAIGIVPFRCRSFVMPHPPPDAVDLMTADGTPSNETKVKNQPCEIVSAIAESCKALVCQNGALAAVGPPHSNMFWMVSLNAG